MSNFAIVPALAGAVLILAGPSRAQTTDTASAPISSQQELVIGTKEAPPFAMKAADGSWSGISIDLWRHVADELHLRYRFSEEPTVQGLIDGVAAGRFDVAVAALTVTAARERIVDFTEPFYATGLGIAVPAGGEASWLPVIRTMTSFGFAQAIAALVGLAIVVGCAHAPQRALRRRRSEGTEHGRLVVNRGDDPTSYRGSRSTHASWARTRDTVDGRLDRRDRHLHCQHHVCTDNKASAGIGARSGRLIVSARRSGCRDLYRGYAFPISNNLPKIRDSRRWS